MGVNMYKQALPTKDEGILLLRAVSFETYEIACPYCASTHNVHYSFSGSMQCVDCDKYFTVKKLLQKEF